ncbi:hypothetical protein DFJ58DRAFT_885948 [Suillus subalutaceus]|uniref:uncharacterized protein n=1 Tax=Suillus subalutaceus TaxID=48586 RepID=UPI001B87627A|nr:uncharacterized protein DFJ58DRAFT_885948 [Suillus subalutaceus]KAG1851854.1 hypothetical protein DFJ58DRAFT_885948 [Suillus subalutaceus]
MYSLRQHFLTAATQYYSPPPRCFPFSQTGLIPHTLPRSNLGQEPFLGVPLGAGTFKRDAKYVLLIGEEKTWLDHVDIANKRWRIGRVSKYGKQKRDGTPDATEWALVHVI